jgi:hypothetical protein
MDQLKILYTFAWDWEAHEKEEVYALVAKNIEQKMDAYLIKLISKDADMEVKVKMTLERTHKWTYNGSFILSYSWSKKPFVYIREWFVILNDLVNHAFDHFKLKLSDIK